MRLVLKEMDPRGVALRQARRLRRRSYFSKGPNFIWHLDSYDKLKPYGICINASIDGFSRKIIWLNAYTTNSNPKVIGDYYIEAVQRLRGCPRVVRGDLGTENGHVRGFQRFLVPMNPNDTLDSYMEGASTGNQRIEYWWRFLCSQCVEFWLSLFEDIRDNGYFDGGSLDKNLLQYCFMGPIQDELDETAQVWNAHSIRPSKNINIPSGRPNVIAEGTSGFRACPYSSSFKPSTSTSKPVQSGYQQKASDQPVQSAYQQVASPKPVWSSSPPNFVSQKVGFDSSAVGLSGSRAYSYTPSFTPSTSASQPVQSTYQQKPVQTASQRVASAQPVLSSYRSGLYSQNVGFDSSAGTGSGVSSYTSSFRPPTSISKPVPSSYQQVTLSQPVQSRYQDVPFSQTSYGASLSGVTSTGSRSVYTPSDSVASAQAFRSPYSYAQALSSLDNSQPSAGSPRLTWTQKVLE
ncbi:hypothetical protein MHYP_G00273790 [Metynnis hypsauchen]